MSAPTPVVSHQAMAEQAQSDNRASNTGVDMANETSARGPIRRAFKQSSPLLLSQYVHEGIGWMVYGTGHEVGKCTIDEIKVAQCAINFIRMIPADVICAMTAECNRVALARAAAPPPNDSEFRRR